MSTLPFTEESNCRAGPTERPRRTLLSRNSSLRSLRTTAETKGHGLATATPLWRRAPLCPRLALRAARDQAIDPSGSNAFVTQKLEEQRMKALVTHVPGPHDAPDRHGCVYLER